MRNTKIKIADKKRELYWNTTSITHILDNMGDKDHDLNFLQIEELLTKGIAERIKNNRYAIYCKVGKRIYLGIVLVNLEFMYPITMYHPSNKLNYIKDKMTKLKRKLISKGKRNAKDSIDQVNLNGSEGEPLDPSFYDALVLAGLPEIDTWEKFFATCEGKPCYQLS
jgi:hypothetical protein